MKKDIDLAQAVLDTWKTTNNTTVFLVKKISPNLWNKKIPGYPRKTIGMLAIHLHNARCGWIKSIDLRKSRKPAHRIDPYKVTKKEVVSALKQSSTAMKELLIECIKHGGHLPTKPVWMNFPTDVLHLLTYFVAHEGHHRGQILMAARQVGRPFGVEVTGGVWQWTKRLNDK